MPESAGLKPKKKTAFEKLRMPLTWLVLPLWLALLVATRPPGFETAPYEILEIFGLFLVFAAVIGRLWCSLYISGRKDKQLCVSGPYSLSRNPLYFFSLLGLMGVCLVAQNLVLLFISVLAFFAYYSIVIATEERRLELLFGEEFQRYVATTPRLIPRFAPPVTEEKILVSTNAFLRAMGDAGWFLMAVVVLELVEDLHESAVSIFTLPF